LVVNNLDKVKPEDREKIVVTLMTSETGSTVGDVTLTDNIFNALYTTTLGTSDDGMSVVLVAEQKYPDNPMGPDLPINATAGSELLWDERFDIEDGTVLEDVLEAALEQAEEGDTAALTKTLSGLAGSTINSTGTAQRDSLRNHMGMIRDRALGLGRQAAERPVSQRQYWVQNQKGGKGGYMATASSLGASQTGYHFWIEGNGGYSHLRTQVDKGGYKLTSWGGTVGADMVLDNVTLGLALSASYGDLRSQAGERATGDLDSLYLSFFGHYQKNAWGHTLVLTGTTTDAELNRTVDYGKGYYMTHGDTNGYGLGLLYELTYDIPLNDAGTSLLQPLFDASIVRTQLDAYNETGAGNASLNVHKQEWTTGAVALGARWSGSFGAETVGRTLFGELRAAVSQDLGDTQGKTLVALQSSPEFTRHVYGSKVGATAFQLSGGLSTQVGQNGLIYANVGGELRNDANSVNGAVGYRYSF
jgi:hypothetical protein